MAGKKLKPIKINITFKLETEIYLKSTPPKFPVTYQEYVRMMSDIKQLNKYRASVKQQKKINTKKGSVQIIGKLTSAISIGVSYFYLVHLLCL